MTMGCNKVLATVVARNLHGYQIVIKKNNFFKLFHNEKFNRFEKF